MLFDEIDYRKHKTPKRTRGVEKYEITISQIVLVVIELFGSMGKQTQQGKQVLFTM